jgi:hypothetical protein
VLLVESEALHALYSDVASFTKDYDAGGHPTWLPHMTVGYGDIDAEALEARVGESFTVAAIRVAIGDDAVDHPLGVIEEEPMPEEPVGPDEAELAAGNVTEFSPGRKRRSDEDDDEDEDMYRLGDDGAWEGILIVEGLPSGDGRMIAENALTWRDLPLPLMAQFRNPDGGQGHDAAVIVGRIERIQRVDNQLWGAGTFDLGSEAGREAHRLVAEGFMRGVSADLDMIEAELDEEALLSGGVGGMTVLAGRIMGATLVSFPAFEEAFLRLVEPGETAEGPEDALVASGAIAQAWTPWDAKALVASGSVTVPVAPPSAWFDPPSAEELTALRASGRSLTVTDDGRVYGVAAIFGSEHIGVRGVRPPRSRNRYAYFQTGEVHCAEGEVVSTGPLVAGTYHPDLYLPASDAQAFYADTGAAFADVTVHEVRCGREELMVFTGALRPDVDAVLLRTVRGSDGVSPDWRRIGGRLECVAMIAVNNTGFKVPALAASAGAGGDDERRLVQAGRTAVRYGEHGEPVALVAAGAVRASRDAAVAMLSAQMRELRNEVEELRASVRPLRAQRAATLLLAVDPPAQAAS